MPERIDKRKNHSHEKCEVGGLSYKGRAGWENAELESPLFVSVTTTQCWIRFASFSLFVLFTRPPITLRD